MKQNLLCSDRIVNFAAFILRDAETCSRCSDRLYHARYYTQTFAQTIVIFNIMFEEVKKLAKEHDHIPFLFGQRYETGISVTYWKWSLLAGNKGRLRRGYAPKSSKAADKTGIESPDKADVLLFSEFGLTENSLQEAAASVLEKMQRKQKKLGCSDQDFASFIRKSLDDQYYVKGRYFSRATLYNG